MSRWLNSVNTILEKLDGQVETAIEERADDDDQQVGTVDSILLRRGLSESSAQQPPEEPADTKELGKENLEEKESTEEFIHEQEPVNVPKDDDDEQKAPVAEPPPEVELDDEQLEEVPLELESTPEAQVSNDKEAADALSPKHDVEVSGNVDPAKGQEEKSAEEASLSLEKAKTEPTLAKKKPEIEPTLANEDPIDAFPTSAVNQVNDPTSKAVSHQGTPGHKPTFEKEYKTALSEAREAQKEARTLRRHVVSLNSELETAEAEIQAQRTELERAAERMEKDRSRQKEEKEQLVARHAEEIKALKLQHQQTLTAHKTRSDQQLEDARERTKEIEERRMQEGGDWTKELQSAVQREQETARRLSMFEDEKSTLLSQVSSLQAQQAALEQRLESVSRTADNAMEREREAEDRLDAALSMHARQLTLRQARESELERTVADLGAALVVARNKEINRLKSEQQGEESGPSNVSSLRTRLEDAQDELETVKAHLELERQRSKTLQQDFQEMSKERTAESSAAHARQLQSDRKIADMSVTISRLQANLREASRSSLDESGDSVFGKDEDDKSKQIKSLSEQVMQLQEKAGQSKSEISALKKRLQVALSRADKAEEALSSLENTDELYDRMESAPASGSFGNGSRTMRRRGGRHSPRDAYGSIRSAILSNSGQGDNREKIGKAIDVVDSFSVQTGKYLRYNPLARAAFLVYLLMIHFWALAILVFHAHGYETVHGDFGAANQLPHGPHALMQANVPPVPSNP